MTVIGEDREVKPETSGKDVNAGKDPDARDAAERESGKYDESGGIFSQERIAEDTEVEIPDDVDGDAPGREGGLKSIPETRTVTVTAEDKVRFIDAVASNSRFERNYTLFGGRISLTVRSITAEESNALAAWAFKKAVADPTWNVSGRGRRHILVAQIARFNGTDMPPMEKPLFETLGSDGKTLSEPGWVGRADFWEGIGAGVVDAVMNCISDFDTRYRILCEKAEDENFWLPDTP